MSDKWDAVIVGSGISGLTCGAFLAKKGMRVKILEKHYRIGGYAHSFNRGDYRFESGIHSVPLDKNGYVAVLLKELGIQDKITTISHDCMYTTRIGENYWRMPAKFNQIQESLFSYFPHERHNIQALFADMDHLYKVIVGPLLSLGEKGNESNPSLLTKYQEHTYQTYIESYISDPKLRQLFFSQWPFAGLTPECSSTTFFSLLYYVHAIEGSHYLKGGFETLAHAIASVITDNGGEIATNSTVKRLHTENGTIRHAELESGEIIEANHFISNVSPYVLMEKLLEENSRNRLWIRRLNHLSSSTSATAVYLGLDKSISDLLPENIHFWYKHGDFSKMRQRIMSCSSKEIDHLIFLKTPDASENQTLFLMTYVNYNHCQDWSTEKESFASSMIDTAEQVVPGLSKHIQCKVLASPATFERYTGNTNGSLYGFSNTSDRYSEAKIPMQTYIPNLYQTGHWCRGGGVWNVMESGFKVSKMVLKKS